MFLAYTFKDTGLLNATLIFLSTTPIERLTDGSMVDRLSGLYLALSALYFVQWHLYNSYFAFGAHWNVPSTDTRP